MLLLGADHLIPRGGGCEKKIVQQILENKKFVQPLLGKNSLFMK